MKRTSRPLATVYRHAAIVACVAASWIALPACSIKPLSPSQILGEFEFHPPPTDLEITYPRHGTLFPPEVPPPTLRWQDTSKVTWKKHDLPGATCWVVGFVFLDSGESLAFQSDVKEWTPGDAAWEQIKDRSLENDTSLVVLGVDDKGGVVSFDTATFRTSKDEVGAPLFYREVNLPFVDAVKDPSDIAWRFGSVSSTSRPPVVLDDLPVCGNCHSFSADGSVLGMDVDYANDKGSYAIVDVAKQIVLDKEHVITWSDYERGDGELTFGLLSQVSPDGRYVVSTVKDRSVFVPKPDLAFSQLFFPVKGILAVYDRETKQFAALPGADDKRFVNSNPAWSPDGEQIVFTRAPAHTLRTAKGKILLSKDECREFLKDGKEFKFDVYRVPFNGGAGGEALPVEGASNNGMSNFFPRYSPDGKWLVFCKAANFSLLQPDSRLYIVPASGGTPREMRCNTPRMNSWHSWSPNGRWLVFTSKANGAYTQLWLTHVDEKGQDAPAVLLDRLTSPDRAANIPEFVNAKAGAIASITERFVDDVSFVRAAKGFLNAGDEDSAVAALERALSINPKSLKAHTNLGAILSARGDHERAVRHHRQAVEADPTDARAQFNLAVALEGLGQFELAVRAYAEAARLDPADPRPHFNLGVAHMAKGDLPGAIRHYAKALQVEPGDAKTLNNLGSVLQKQGDLKAAEARFREAIEADPRHVRAYNNLGTVLMMMRRPKDARDIFVSAVEISPDYAKAHSNLGAALQQLGDLDRAVWHYREALRLAPGLQQARRNLDIIRMQGGR